MFDTYGGDRSQAEHNKFLKAANSIPTNHFVVSLLILWVSREPSHFVSGSKRLSVVSIILPQVVSLSKHGGDRSQAEHNKYLKTANFLLTHHFRSAQVLRVKSEPSHFVSGSQLVLIMYQNKLLLGICFDTYGVLSKKFELISPKICRAGGIPPRPPLPPARRSDPFGLKNCQRI
mgnify:CR=1 FL=1